jgi:hypothetical protein
MSPALVFYSVGCCVALLYFTCLFNTATVKRCTAQYKLLRKQNIYFSKRLLGSAVKLSYC